MANTPDWADQPTNTSAPDWASDAGPSAPSWATSTKSTPAPAPVVKAQAPEPKSDITNIGRGLHGAYMQGVGSNLLMQPVRWAMQASDFGGYKQKLKDKYPGKTDDWYDTQMDKVYNQAITGVRQDAQQETAANPYPGHQVGNFVAGLVGSADPTWLIAPGASASKTVVGGIAKQAAVQGGLAGIADLAGQGLDAAAGMDNKYDPKRNLEAVAGGAAFGGAFHGLHEGIHSAPFQDFVAKSNAPAFVKKAFTVQHPDAKAPDFESQVGQQSAINTPELQAKQREVFSTGTADDIHKFYDEVGGPRPSKKTVEDWMQTRQSWGTPIAPKQSTLDAQIHRDTIAEHIQDQTKDWKNKPQVNVHDTMDTLPPEVQKTAAKDGITPDNTVGFLGSDGQVHVFANQVKTPEAASAVLFHESLGHYGLAQKFGTKLDSVLNTLVTKNVGQFGKKVEKWVADNPEAYGGNKLRAAEEVLAEMSQDGPLPKSVGDAVVSTIRQFARNRGLNLSYSDAEVGHILSLAHDAVINGKGRDVVANRFGGLNNYQPTDFGPAESRQMYAGMKANKQPKSANDYFFGPDGNARFEISDHNAEWHENLMHTNSIHDLDEVLVHPELFKNYPELRNTKVHRDEIGNYEGMFDPDTKTLHINIRAQDPKSTALHEIQHWIQFKEGWQAGGNTSMFNIQDRPALKQMIGEYDRQLKMADTTASEKFWEKKRSKAQDLIEANPEITELMKTADEAKRNQHLHDMKVERLKKEMRDASMVKGTTFEEVKAGNERFANIQKQFIEASQVRRKAKERYDTVLSGLEKLKSQNEDLAYDYYRQLMGEVEARDTQKRMYMTPQERKGIAPYAIEGIQPKDMIMRHQDMVNRSEDRRAIGEEQVNPDELDTIDRLKQNPRFFSDPEYRQNVIELARAQSGISTEPEVSSIPAASGFKSEAEARAAQQSRQMTPEQLQKKLANGDVDIQHLEDTYERVYKDYEPTHRSDLEIKRAATAAGFTTAKVKGQKNMEDLSARIYKSQMAAKLLDEKIRDLADKEGTAAWTVRDADNVRKAIADHSYILTRLYDDQSELGRALRTAKMGYTHASMRAYQEMLAEHGGPLGGLADDETLSRFLRSFKQVSAGGTNPNGINALVRGLQKPNWEEYLLTARSNMMLSGLSTHVTAITDMIDGIGYELMDHTAGLIPSLGREGLRTLGIKVQPGIHPAEVGARYWGVLRAAMDANTYTQAMHTLKNGHTGNTSGGKQYARIPLVSKIGDLIATEDQFFRAFATNMHLYGLGVRKAVEEARLAGKKPSMDDLITQGSAYAQAPSPAMLKEAEKAAQTNLLLGDNLIVKPLDALRSTPRLAPGATMAEKSVNVGQRAASFIVNFMLPFVRTATNSLYQRVWKRSPLTLLDPHTLSDLSLGGVKADVAMGRILLASASTAIAWSAAEKGITSGEGPDNPAKKALKMAGGWRPKSVDAGDRYNVNQNLGNRLNPFDLNSQTATMIASLHDAYKAGANGGQIATGMKMAVYSTLKNIGDNAWLGDVAKDVGTFTQPGRVDQKDQFVADQAASFIPALSGQIARVQDQGQPMTTVSGDLGQTVKNTLMSKIPGQREKLPDRMTPLGTPVQSGTTLAGQSTGILPQGNRITGGQYINKTTDPAEKEIIRLDDFSDKAVVTAVQRTITVDHEKKKLTNEEFSKYQQLAGRTIVENVREMMGTEDWKAMTDEEKAGWVNDMQKAAKKDARDQLFSTEEE